jgi:hypothetical protein
MSTFSLAAALRGDTSLVTYQGVDDAGNCEWYRFGELGAHIGGVARTTPGQSRSQDGTAAGVAWRGAWRLLGAAVLVGVVVAVVPKWRAAAVRRLWASAEYEMVPTSENEKEGGELGDDALLEAEVSDHDRLLGSANANGDR